MAMLKGEVFFNDCEAELPIGGKSYSLLAWEDRHNVDKATQKIGYIDASYLVENDFYYWMERDGHIFVLDLPADDEPYPDIADIDVKLGLEKIDCAYRSFRSKIIETLKDLGETSYVGNDLVPNYFVIEPNSDGTRGLVLDRLKKAGYKVFIGVDEDEMLTFFVYGNLSPLAWKDDDDE